MKPHVRIRKRLPFVEQGELYARYSEENPAHNKFDEFCERHARRLNCTTEIVRECIARFDEIQSMRMNQERYTESQRIAMMMGASKSRIMETLIDALDATKSELIYEQVATENGSEKYVKTDEHGDFVVHEQPDWRARMEATKQLSSIHGANAPEQLTVDMHTKVSHLHTLTIEDLHAELGAFPAEIRASIGYLLPPADAKSSGTVEGDQGEKGYIRQAVLDTALYEDKGRTGA